MATKQRQKRVDHRTPQERIHDRALGLLAVRWRSHKEMADRLRLAGFEPVLVDAELRRLEDSRLLDDQRFAEEFTLGSVTSRRVGRRAVIVGLRQKGIARETIDAVTAGLTDEQEEVRALELATVRVRRLTNLDRPTAFSRLSDFLMRRGFDPAIARRVSAQAIGAELDEPE
ncbi:MAG: regulatory protein RecX [Actinomycetota bacterium]